MKNLKFCAVAGTMAAALIAPGSASANAIVQSLTVDINPAITLNGSFDASPTSSFNDFNPSLGTLNSIAVSFGGTVDYRGSSSLPSVLNFFAVFNGVTFTATGNTGGLCIGYGLCSVSLSFTDTADRPFLTGLASNNFGLVLNGLPGEQVTTNFDGDFPLTGSITYNYTPPAGVPEPITLSVFGAGLAGAAALRRRKKAQNA